MFGKDAPIGRQGFDYVLHGVEIAIELGGEIGLAGEVRAVTDPDGQGLGA